MTTDLSLRHVLATLAYRAAKPLRDAPPTFSDFRLAAESRSAGEILAHMCDLMDWALSIARGTRRWQDTAPRSWIEDAARFFAAVNALDDYLASGAEFHANAGKLFQGGLADALTHVGQLAMLRHLAGAKIKGENYYEAAIELGRVGLDQPPAVREFD